MQKNSAENEVHRFSRSSFWIDFFIGFLAWFIIHGIGWAVFEPIAESFIPDGIGLLLLCFQIPLAVNIVSLILLSYKNMGPVAFGVMIAILLNSMGIVLMTLLM